MPRRRAAARGFTLIELVVATAVVAFATLAISSGFIALNRIIQVEHGIRAGQASARQALQQITPKLRLAGYGVEPAFAFGFPPNWRRGDPNVSDRLVFYGRNPMVLLEVAGGGNGATRGRINLRTSLRSPLPRGQIIQVVCPGASTWSYGRLAEPVEANTAVLPLAEDTGSFPNLNARFDEPCFSGAPGVPAYVFKIEEYDFRIASVDVDGPLPRPYLFQTRGEAMEPIAEDIEALRVTFLKADGAAFIPNPALPAPAYDTAENDPLRANDNPANIRSVRVALVARTSVPDTALREARLGNAIPAFAGEAEIVLPGKPEAVGGYRRLLYDSTVRVRNMSSTAMFIPPLTTDRTPGVCAGTKPVDGLNCSGG